MKRILSCLLCLVLLGLSACQNQRIPPPESQTSSGNVSADPAEISLPLSVEDGAIILGGTFLGHDQGRHSGYPKNQPGGHA